ncbi:MAG: respiratory nitrate reductase subunit gamma [Nitrospiraceae bacterium]
MAYLDVFFFQLYPYIAGTVFLVGSWLRFERGQYTWSSDSSELLARGSLRWGSNLFHIGVLSLFMGHLALLIPANWLTAIGLIPHRHQILAIVTGLLFAVACLVGLVLLMHRRATQPRVRATTRPMDVVVLVWILLVLGFGMSTIYFSSQELSGTRLVALSDWTQRIITFRGGAAELVAEAHWVYKVHIVLGMTLFALVPFSRLVHIWSGFATVVYLFRPHLVVRPAWRNRNIR